MKKDEPRSLLSRFVGGTVSVGMGNLSTMVFGLAGTIVVARSLPAEDFGAFVLLQVIAALLARVTSLGLDLSVPRFLTDTDDPERGRDVFGTALGLRVVVIAPVGVLVLYAQPVLAGLFGSSPLASYFGYVPVLYFLQSLGQLLLASLQGLFRFRNVAWAAFVASASNFVLILLLVLVLHLAVPGLIYAKVVSMGLAYVYAFVSIPLAWRPRFSTAVAKRILRFGLPLQLNDILTFAYMRIDTFLIGALLGPAEIAYYEVARKIPESLTGLYEAFRTVYFPFVSKLHSMSRTAKLAEVLNNSTRLISFFTIMGALIALLFGNDIITMLFSERYLPSVPVFVLLMIGLNLAVVEYTLGYSLVAVGESDKPLIVNAVRTVINLLSNVTLIPVLGTSGAALAKVAANLFTGPLDIVFLRRKGVAAEYLAWVKPILVFALCGAAFLSLSLPAWPFKLMTLVVFLGASGLLSVITVNDVTAILAEVKDGLSRISGRPTLETSR